MFYLVTGRLIDASEDLTLQSEHGPQELLPVLVFGWRDTEVQATTQRINKMVMRLSPIRSVIRQRVRFVDHEYDY